MATPKVPREDIEAALSARREMGPEYDDAFVDSVVARVNETIDARLPAARREAGSPSTYDQAKAERNLHLAVACTSLGVSIPLTAIAAGTGGLPAIVVVWIGIGMVNLAASIRSRRR